MYWDKIDESDEYLINLLPSKYYLPHLIPSYDQLMLKVLNHATITLKKSNIY